MGLKPFLISLGFAFGVIIAFNLLLAATMDSVAGLTLRHMHAQRQIDMLFAGNSLIASGVDPRSVEMAWPSTPAPAIFNLGLGSSSPVEHYLLVRRSYLSHPEIHYLIYGFFDFDLTKFPGDSWNDLGGNRSMAYFIDPSTAANLYEPGSKFAPWRFRLIGMVPMLRQHSQLWKYVDLVRRKLEEIGLPKEKTNEYGRIADFEAMGSPEQPQFDQECELAVRNSVPLLPAVSRLLHLAKERNTKMIVVEMPVTAVHRSQCYASKAWQDYRAHLQDLIKSEGASYLIASDWIRNDSDFSDGLHLNHAGANVFSSKIALAIAKDN